MLSRCQEALKIIEDEKFIGRFTPRVSQKLLEAEKKAAEKCKGNNQSPLRKGVTVRFNFTVPVSRRTHSKNIDQQSPKMSVHKLLSLLGMSENADLNSPIPEEITGQLEDKKKEELIFGVPPVKEVTKRNIETFSASTQTEFIPCEKCEHRNTIKYANIQTQTIKDICEIGTQVSVEDLTKSCTTFIPRGILKTNSSPVKSISHLTPAQLLAQMESGNTENTSSQKQDNYPPARRPLLDHRMGSDMLPESTQYDRPHPGNRFGGQMGGHSGQHFSQGMGMGRTGNYGHGPSMGTNNPMGANRPLLNTPYPNRPQGSGPNGPGPNPNHRPGPNYSMNQGSNQGRPFQEGAPNWGNPGMGIGMGPRPNHNMYYNQQ